MNQHRCIRLFRLLAIFLIIAMSMVTPTGIIKADTADTTLEKSDSVQPVFQSGSPSPWEQAEGSRMVGVTILPEEAAYYHLVLLPDDAAPPTKEQVVEGTDGNGNLAIKAIDSRNTKTTGISIQIYAGEHSTDYDIYVVLRDDVGNLSEPAKVDVTSPDSAYLIKGDGLNWHKDGNFVVTGAAGDTEYDLYMVVGDTSKDYPLTRCTEVQHM
jgi:hypothetical protein